MYNYHSRGEGSNTSNRGLARTFGKGLLAILSVSGVAGLEGCNLDGTPAIRIADDPLSKAFPIFAPGVGHAVSDKNGGAAISEMGAATGAQKNAESGRSNQIVIVNPKVRYENDSDDPDFGIALKDVVDLTPRQIDKVYRTFKELHTSPKTREYLKERWYLLTEDQKKVLRHYISEGLPKD